MLPSVKGSSVTENGQFTQNMFHPFAAHHFTYIGSGFFCFFFTFSFSNPVNPSRVAQTDSERTLQHNETPDIVPGKNKQKNLNKNTAQEKCNVYLIQVTQVSGGQN